jgi:hypothetical protein
VTASFREVEQRVDDASERVLWSAGSSWLGQGGFEIGRLGVGEVGGGMFCIASSEAAAAGSVSSQHRNSNSHRFL